MCYKKSLGYPLKASILSDICARLTQKIVMKVLFLKSQLRNETNNLFQAYFDLLVVKPYQSWTLSALRKCQEIGAQKHQYLQYAMDQL